MILKHESDDEEGVEGSADGAEIVGEVGLSEHFTFLLMFVYMTHSFKLLARIMPIFCINLFKLFRSYRS